MGSKEISLLIVLLVVEIDCKFEFTNFECTSFKKSLGDFEYCYLKSMNRSYKYISGRYKLNQIPFMNFKINFILWKRLSGYKPFLYNITIDACRFLGNPKSNPVMKYVFDSFQEYSNINHSCPYSHDLILEKLPIDFMNHRVTEILPIPEGSYLIQLRWIQSKSLIAEMKIYCNIS
ncbi:uncharacterized protein LOC108104210 [Drosophila eugracilis]|uniref:uncharacterized protein LOC108104210 n=1 Tax=Drosophila eugracilis TaxID=29029 RepID=UPI0007E83639|nr:uncharacterized protein LOC108104210 [Drosophila eugracilis]